MGSPVEGDVGIASSAAPRKVVSPVFPAATGIARVPELRRHSICSDRDLKLPVPYYHVVFTLPARSAIAFQNKALRSTISCSGTAAETLTIALLGGGLRRWVTRRPFTIIRVHHRRRPIGPAKSATASTSMRRRAFLDAPAAVRPRRRYCCWFVAVAFIARCTIVASDPPRCAPSDVRRELMTLDPSLSARSCRAASIASAHREALRQRRPQRIRAP